MFLGIDIGSSRTKGVLARRDGTVEAVAVREHEVSYPSPGWAEHDAEGIWWAETADVAHELVGRSDEPIQAVGVAGLGPCLLVTDHSGRPLRPAILYGIDIRARAEIDELNARYARVSPSLMLTSQSVAPKLAWLRRHEPETWAATRRIFTAHSYVVHRLTGAYVLDHHTASASTPIYEPDRGSWEESAAQDIAPGLELPRLLWPSELAGETSEDAATATGIPAGTPVVMGTLNSWMDAISVDAKDPGDRTLAYGSTMVLIGFTDRAHSEHRVPVTPGVFPGTHTVAAGTAAAGALTHWFQGIVGDVSLAELLAEASAIAPGAGGLLALPYFSGERAPLFDPQARGLIIGLTLSHGRGHVYRALLESTAFAVRAMLESLTDMSGQWQPLKAVGAGGAGGLWTQTVSDVSGEQRLLSREALGACYGSAWLAGVAAGYIPRYGGWNEIVGSINPNPDHFKTYQRLYGMYRELYPATASFMHRLADLGPPEGFAR